MAPTVDLRDLKIDHSPLTYTGLTQETMVIMLRDLVAAMGTAKAAAESLGISDQYLCDILRGRRDISAALAHKLGFERRVIYIRR